MQKRVYFGTDECDQRAKRINERAVLALNENPRGTTRAADFPRAVVPRRYAPRRVPARRRKTGDLVEKASERGLFICVVTRRRCLKSSGRAPRAKVKLLSFAECKYYCFAGARN